MKKNKKLKLLLICLAIIFTVFLGNIYASNARKGELNGDDEINYEDVSLLQLHLLQIKELPEDKLDLADMNNDKKITITDLNLLIKKIEKELVYEVTISDMKSSNYYPNKNEDIVISFNADVNYDGKIDSAILNNKKYNATLNEETGLYETTVNVGNNSGIQEYKITEVTLKEGQTVEVNSSVSVKVDVLKDIPTITDYAVTEDLQNSKLHISFNVNDPDSAFKSDSHYYIVEATDETENVYNVEDGKDTEGNSYIIDPSMPTGVLKVGKNNIEVSVEENKKYILTMCIEYNLDSDSLANDTGHTGTALQTQTLELVANYNLELSNINTYRYKNDVFEKVDEFYKNESIIIRFNSINNTDLNPVSAIVNGNTYEIIKQNNENEYAITIDGLETLGNNTLKIEQIILDNGKVIDTDKSITVKITKNVPSLPSGTAHENLEEKTIELELSLKDSDKTITKLIAKLFNENDNEIAEAIDLTKVLSNQTSTDNIIIPAKFDITNYLMLNKYKVKVFADYALFEDDENYVYQNEKIFETELDALPVVNIKNAIVSNKYPEKNENVRLTYEFETNKESLTLDRIVVNNLRCIPIKDVDELGNVSYSVIIGVGEQAGILDLNTTEFIFEENLSASVSNTVKVDVLKDKPTSEDFTQVDDIENRSVTLTAHIVDPDKSFVKGKGKAELVKNSTGKIVATKTFDAEDVTFTITDLELNTAYTLVTKMTYDRDTNTLEEEDNKNYFEDEIFSTRLIELITNYDLKLSNLTTHNEQGETKYFAKNENIILEFISSTNTDFYPAKAVINGVEYELEKQEDTYRAVLPGDGEKVSGSQKIVIQKIILNNTKEIEISENNSITVEILKNKPTISNYTYSEGENNSINTSFKVNDDEDTITSGTLVITDEFGNEIKNVALVKDNNEVTFNKSSKAESYTLKVTATYNNGHTNYENEVLLKEEIIIHSDAIELKDVISNELYYNNEKIEKLNITNGIPNDLENYYVKVTMKSLPTYYANVKEFRLNGETNRLSVILDQNEFVTYQNEGNKWNKYGEYSFRVSYEDQDGIKYANIFEAMNNNPYGTFELEEDLDAKELKAGNTIVGNFRGKLNGNGHKIYNLTTPLFESLQDATIENLVLDNVNLAGANSKGTIANTGSNVTMKNVHIRNLNVKTGANQTAGFIGTATGGTIEECSLTNANITTSGHIRIAGIIGYMSGGTIKNCYVQGTMTSTQSKDGNGIGGIVGHATGNAVVTIENCISKIEFTWTGGGPRLNGAILGLSDKSNAVLKNNISLSTGTIINKVVGSAIGKTSTNNYELEESTLVSNASGTVVKIIAKENVSREFFKNSANFDEDIWDLTEVSYDKLPILKKKPTISDSYENKNNIPNYEEIRLNTEYYQEDKEILYYNLSKLMPFADTKKWLKTGNNTQATELLTTTKIKFILPLGEENKKDKLVIGLQSGNERSIKKIRIVYENEQREDFNLQYVKTMDNIISTYKIKELNLEYQFDNYVKTIDEDLLNNLVQKASSLDYKDDIRTITDDAELRLYIDYYNESVKENLSEAFTKYMLNEMDVPTYINNKYVKENIEKIFTDDYLKKFLYTYNYYEKWYHFELNGKNVNGVKLSDLIFFNGRKFNNDMTTNYMIDAVLTSNADTRKSHRTVNLFNNKVQAKVDNKNLVDFLAYLFKVVDDYDDPSDWWQANFKGITYEQKATGAHSEEIYYRIWPIITRSYTYTILPILSAPNEDMYIITVPSQFIIGSMNRYSAYQNKDGNERNRMKESIAAYAASLGRFYGTSAGFITNAVTLLNTSGCKVQYDTRHGFPTPAHGKWSGGSQSAGTTEEPVLKWVYEAIGGAFSDTGGVGAYADGTHTFWVVDTALGGGRSINIFTHETAHCQDGSYFYSGNGRRGYTGAECHADGVIAQSIGATTNVFNLIYDLDLSADYATNLSYERINTVEKIDSYYNNMYETKYVLEYLAGQAFLKLTPEEQAKVATQMQHVAENPDIHTFETNYVRLTGDDFRAMNLKTMEDLWDNHIAIHNTGIAVTTQANPWSDLRIYNYDPFYNLFFYIPSNPNGASDVITFKRIGWEMLGYAGWDKGFLNYMTRRSANDLQAIQTITGDETMTWKKYKMSRYETVKENLSKISYYDVDELINLYERALKTDATNGNWNTSTAVTKAYYGIMKRATNDFRTGGIYDNPERTSITSAQQLIDAINNNAYGNYRIDSDLDFSDIEPAEGTNYYITNRFLGTIDGNGHKLTGIKYTLFNSMVYAHVKNITIERPTYSENIKAYLSLSSSNSIVYNNIVINSNKNVPDIVTKSGAMFSVGKNEVTIRSNEISSIEEFVAINQSGLALQSKYVLTQDLDFSNYQASGNVVISGTFTGVIDGNGHTISNLTNASLFKQFNGTVENLNIRDFSNVGTGNFVCAFASNTNNATLKNMKFEGITLQGANNIAVVSGFDNQNSTFENISVKNANVTGTGVYVSTFVGRKYGGTIKNVYVQGTLTINSTENGGLVGALQKGGTVENVITDVNITKTRNTYSNAAASEYNGSMIGNIYDTPKIKNCIAFGNMSGYIRSGTELLPYKFTGATEAQVNACLTNCYEVTEEIGFSRVTDNTAGKLDTVSRENLNKEFYKNLGFDEAIWNLGLLEYGKSPILRNGSLPQDIASYVNKKNFSNKELSTIENINNAPSNEVTEETGFNAVTNNTTEKLNTVPEETGFNTVTDNTVEKSDTVLEESGFNTVTDNTVEKLDTVLEEPGFNTVTDNTVEKLDTVSE